MAKLIVYIGFLLAIFGFTTINALPDQSIKAANGTVLFEVLDGRYIRLPNRHRDKTPTLKFVLHPPVVDTVKQKAGSTTAWTIHLNDGSNVDFTIEEKGGTTEYTWLWHGGGPNGLRDICFNYGYNGASWYNGYQSMNSQWPLKTDKVEAKQQFNYLMDYDRFNSKDKDKETILILEHLFLNTDGFALALDPQQPLFIRRDPNRGDPLICFTVENIAPYNLAAHDAPYLDLKFKIYASKNIRTVTEYVNHQSGFIPKPTSTPTEQMFRQPTWFLWEMNHYAQQSEVEEFLNETKSHGFELPSSELVLDFWESDYGNYTFSKRYPKPDDMLTHLKSHNYDVGVPFYGPFLNDHKPENQHLFVKSKGKWTNIIDFSNPQAAKFYRDKLTTLLGPKKIDTFHLFPHFTLGQDFIVSDPIVQKYPSMMTTKYIETVQKLNKKVITEMAFKTQHLPVFTRLTNAFRESYAQELKEIISDVLSVAISGYSFVIPYSAGGFYTGFKPTEEEFIRMTQAITFMPSMSFTRKPWLYSPKAINIVKGLIKLHAEHAPTIIELAKRRVADGSLIIRPLWYLEPDNLKTYQINDQFLLGEDIMVAPVLTTGQRERMVHFPPGVWLDQHGKSFTGPAEIKVLAPLEELPYFKGNGKWDVFFVTLSVSPAASHVSINNSRS